MQLPPNQTQSVVVPVSLDYIKSLTNHLEAEIKVSTELARTVDKLRSDAKLIKDKTVKFFKEKQEDHVTLTQAYHKLNKELIDMTTDRDELDAIAIGLQEDLAHWHGKYFDLVKENKEKSNIKDASENKVNLSQSEIDFLKSYLSLSLKDAAESISNLKEDAKFYKHKDTMYSDYCYKDSEKLKKKAKVLSGIQHKLKKTVLNREVKVDSSFDMISLTQQSSAWYAVTKAIQQYIPDMYECNNLTGSECAVRAVHALGKSQQQWDKLEGMMTLSLKGVK